MRLPNRGSAILAATASAALSARAETQAAIDAVKHEEVQALISEHLEKARDDLVRANSP